MILVELLFGGFMKKKITALILCIAAAMTAFSVYSYASFGSGVRTLTEEAKLIKSGLSGQRIVFSDADFKRALGIADFGKITITSLPKSSEGTLLYAGRRMRENQSVKRRNIGSIVFTPASKDVTECKFTFTIDDLLGGNEIECVLKFADKVNYAPKAKIEDAVVFAQGEIAVSDRMRASDPEGDGIEYMVVSFPKYGYVEYDKSSGKYSYTALGGYVGTDRFAYVARDEYGNYSEPREVRLKISERMCQTVYADMEGREEYNGAIAMTAMGMIW